MAKIKELTVSTGKTIGLPGYSSIKAEAFVTLSLEDGESYDTVYKYAWELVESQVKKQLKDYIDPDWIAKDDETVKEQRKNIPSVKARRLI